MQEAERQFHDRHVDYSAEVGERLTKLKEKIIKSKDDCPIERKNSPGKLRPPFGLIGKMNNLSKTLAEKLVGSPEQWKSPFFTSRFAKKLVDDLENK